MTAINQVAIEIFNSLYYIFPAYCANGAPVLFGGGRPIDKGKKFVDGKPLFGSHKTVRGFVSGVFIGTLVGWAQYALAPKVGLPQGNFSIGLSLSIGALVGDLLGSFIKRRLDLEPGASLVIFDQLDFVLVAMLFSFFVEPPSLNVILIVTILTGPIHLIVNFLAYILRLKKTPW
jgi:CDP-2,3-bis-(O-geranylgeranyl)-sn-glycerol synthase